MRSNQQAHPFRIAVLASGLAILSAACASSSGTPNPGTGGSTGDASTDTKSDAGTGGSAGKADSGTDSATDTKVDTGTDTGPIDVAIDSGAPLVPPWRAFLPLGMPAAGSNSASGTLPDLSPNHYDGTYIGTTITFSNGSMNLTGVGTETVLVPPKGNVPALDVSGSYSVSVWVTMTDNTGYRTFVTSEGLNISSFFLQKRADTNAFAFTVQPSDVVGPGCIAPGPAPLDGGPAQNPVSPAANVQYHLVATHDSTSSLSILYVNGVESGRNICPGGAADTGILGIGHSIFGSNRVDQVKGAIAEVGVINRVLAPSEVADLYMRGRIGMPPPPPIDSGVDTATDAPADTGSPADAGTDVPGTTDAGDGG